MIGDHTIIIGIFVLQFHAAAQHAAVCDFTCLHDSACDFCTGEQRLGDVELCRFGADGMGRHCLCKPGWAGLRCAHQYQTCYDNNHPCYNGGTCISGIEDIYGTEKYFCDCSEATDKKGRRFVGKFCEIEALKACDEDEIKFCVNNQTCKKAEEMTDTDFCDCGKKFVGKHCEFEEGKVPECNLDCMNGGECVLGIKNYGYALIGYNDFWKKQEEAMHCQCKEGFFGVRCEISAMVCGDHHCFNGATCVTTTIDDGGTNFNCDCTSAHNEHVSYAGEFCQYPSTTFCEANGTIEGRDFCVNNGTCRVDKPGCDCQSGFDGPMCEYSLGFQSSAPECKLHCHNSGVCTKGAKDMTLIESLGQSVNHLKDPKHNEDFEFCTCQQGFFGLTCDKKIELCGENEHVCLNGGMCILDENDKWTCDCNNGGNHNRFSGIFCQHDAIVYCSGGNENGEVFNNHFYCLNGGTCKSSSRNDELSGCICPKGFEGENCEKTTGQEITSSSANPISSSGFRIFMAILSTVVFILTISMCIHFKLHHGKEGSKEFDSMDPPGSSTDSMNSNRIHEGESDGDGTFLENIEIT